MSEEAHPRAKVADATTSRFGKPNDDTNGTTARPAPDDMRLPAPAMGPNHADDEDDEEGFSSFAARR